MVCIVKTGPTFSDARIRLKIVSYMLLCYRKINFNLYSPNMEFIVFFAYTLDRTCLQYIFCWITYKLTQSKITEMLFCREEIYSVERDRTEAMPDRDRDD